MTTPDLPTDPPAAQASDGLNADSVRSPEALVAPVAARLPVSSSAKSSPRSSRIANLLLGVAAIVAVSGIAFAAGRVTAPAAAAGGNGGRAFDGNGDLPAGFGNGNGGAGLVGGGIFRGAGGGVIEGTIVSVRSDSMVIEIGSTAAGGQGIQITIPISTSTAIHTQASASSDDLSAGQKVLVQLGSTPAGSTPAPVASGAPRDVQTPASDVTIVAP